MVRSLLDWSPDHHYFASIIAAPALGSDVTSITFITASMIPKVTGNNVTQRYFREW